MAVGYLLKVGDKTTCGGVILTGDSCFNIEGQPAATESSLVSCGKHLGQFKIIGGVDFMNTPTGKAAGTLDSISSCPCEASFIEFSQTQRYGKDINGRQENPASSSIAALIGISSVVAETFKQDKSSNLNYKIEIGKPNILTPLQVPAYGDHSDVSYRKINFHIENKGETPDSIKLEVLDGNNVIYSEPDIHVFIPKGKHNWQWDGFSNQGVLDTYILKSQNLTLQLTAIKNTEIKIFKLKLKNKAEHVDWLDARFDRNKQEVKIEIRPQVSDGGVEGSNRSISIFGYDKLKEIAQEAIGYFWSRDGSRGDINSPIATPMGSYKVTVNAKLNKNPHMSADFDLIEKLDNDFGRSTSLWGFRSIYFNRGISSNDYTLLLFRQTAAHEVGHIILNEATRKTLIPQYSWEHKSSSTLATQKPLKNNPVPSYGEVDLMKYYTEGTLDEDSLVRNVASEEDVLGLIWLLGVKFDD